MNRHSRVLFSFLMCFSEVCLVLLFVSGFLLERVRGCLAGDGGAWPCPVDGMACMYVYTLSIWRETVCVFLCDDMPFI
jgi:hypothetical protein